MNQNPQSNYIQEDEIDLRELFKTIAKRKSFIVIFSSLITIGAIVFALTRPPIYEVKSNIQIGYIGDKLLDNPEVIAKNVQVYFEAMDLKQNKDDFISEVTSVLQGKKLKDFIEITTEANSNEQALQRNKEAVDYIKSLYKNKLEQFKRDTLNQIEDKKREIYNLENLEKKNIEQKIQVIKQQEISSINEEISFIKNNKLKQIDNKINYNSINLEKYNKSVNNLYKQIKNTQDSTLLTVISLQMTNYQNLILNAQNKIADLNLEKENLSINTINLLERKKENIQNNELRKLQYKLDVEISNKKNKLQKNIEQLNYMISSQNFKNSYVVGDYIVKDYPLKPKKKLIVVVAFVTSLILAIFLVFFLEFFRGEEKEDGK